MNASPFSAASPPPPSLSLGAPPLRQPAAEARRLHEDVARALVGALHRLLDAAHALLARLEEDEEDVVAHLEDGHEAAAHAEAHYASDVGHEPWVHYDGLGACCLISVITSFNPW